MPGPLVGLRVLELARILAGPWAGQSLPTSAPTSSRWSAKEPATTRAGGAHPLSRQPMAAILVRPISMPPIAASAR